ncbi:hypothetical protein OS493_001230 [Desmophyllum pertusum]|uniref:Uncharacterized protein n=1 Tax=Desmophyllum pertusum TaxID=174260 RepID=A0A9X0D629_9CNID|nr:hypothetical protein OS493_001230 [Desmophyllum pertusum]
MYQRGVSRLHWGFNRKLYRRISQVYSTGCCWLFHDFQEVSSSFASPHHHTKLAVEISVRAQATKAFLLLQHLLVLHAPSENPSLYQSPLGLHAGAMGYQKREDSWEFIKTICSNRDENSLLLLRFATTLLERDFYEHISGVSAREKLDCFETIAVVANVLARTFLNLLQHSTARAVRDHVGVQLVYHVKIHLRFPRCTLFKVLLPWQLNALFFVTSFP